MRTKLRLATALALYQAGQPVDGNAIADYLAAHGITGIALVDPAPATGDLYVDADQDVTTVLTSATIGDSQATTQLNTAVTNYRAAVANLRAANTTLQGATSTTLANAVKQFGQAEVDVVAALNPILRYLVSNL